MSLQMIDLQDASLVEFFNLGLQMASSLKSDTYREAQKRWKTMNESTRGEAKAAFYAGADSVGSDMRKAG